MPVSWLVAVLVMALGAGLAMPVAAQPLAPAPPSFAELEALQARIGEVRVRTADPFDTANPKEDWTLYRWANALHIQTRASVVEDALLFKSGDRVSVAVIEETERLLRGTRYLYDVQIRPVAYQDGVVDIEVLTRDSWSLIPGVSVSRSGGETRAASGCASTTSSAPGRRWASAIPPTSIARATSCCSRTTASSAPGPPRT